jgi:hypothetical protein
MYPFYYFFFIISSGVYASSNKMLICMVNGVLKRKAGGLGKGEARLTAATAASSRFL